MVKGKAAEYVIVDVETTGLDTATDELLEIAAVKVRRGLIVEEFSTLVKAERPVPAAISELTGIYDEMLLEQPGPRQAVENLAAFIGEARVAAHNAAFDAAFIRRYWPDKRPWLDTIALMQVAYPSAPSYSLANLCEYLQVENERAHRALGDARATAQLFLRARKQLATLTQQARADLLLLAGDIEAPLEELIRTQCAGLGAASSAGINPPAEEAASVPPGPRAVDEQYRIPLEEINNFFAPQGLLKQRMEGFEYREAQRAMAGQVAEKLNDGGFLLAEAGTGTGKSLAYLLPAALFSLNSGRRVGVSTHTKNLQEQLLHKDIPLLTQLLQQPLRAVVLKGRANYLCRRMYRAQIRHPGENMRYFLMRVAAWLPASASGDGGELNLNSYDKWRWQRICAASENCDASCSYYKNSCFVAKARREAEKADIFILNHALLLSNAAMEGGFLPALPQLIIDEAHHLERAAEEQFSRQADFYQLQHLLTRLRRGRSGGLLDTLSRQAEPLCTMETEKEALKRRVSALDDSIEQTVRQAEQFYGLLQQQFMSEALSDPYLPARLRLLAAHSRLPVWPALLNLGQGLAALLNVLNRECLQLAELLNDLAQSSGSELNGKEELLHIALFGGELAATLGDCLAPPGEEQRDNKVCWLEFAARDKLPSLNIAPIELGGLLKSRLYEHAQSLILTSATMTSGGSFSYFKQRLGLDLLDEEPGELELTSPFFYREQALTTVCTSLPDWSKAADGAAQEALAGALLPLLTASRGRALVLFTSHAQLKAVYDLLRAPLAEQGITLLAHGISGEPSLLLARLNREPRCCILGAASFWEGVDVIGSALSLVVIVRLPFWPPNTPTIAARMERIEAAGGASFYEYSLPQAVLRFKQGFGRLIRSTEDTGVFCVLDKRILEKSYGRLFLKSLPEMKRQTGSAQELAEHIRAWLD